MAALVLASLSKTRRGLLTQAGLRILVQPANIDEYSLLTEMNGQTPHTCAQRLAARKAQKVADSFPDSYVIGADQILVAPYNENALEERAPLIAVSNEGEKLKIFQKANSPIQAQQHLSELQGATHQLVSAACVVKDGKFVWRHVEAAAMTMRKMNREEVSEYMSTAGEDVLAAVGCYELEGKGAWLFDRVEGDYFTILGLPLLPLLSFLRTQGFGP